mgnify:CR=1 FL=1
MILNRNQIDHCSRKGQVGGSSPPIPTLSMKQLIFLLIPISLFSQKGLQDTIQYPVDPLEEKYNMIYYSSSLIKKEKKEGAAPIKECECGYLLHARIMECPECGHIFEKTIEEKEKDIIVELQELSKTRLNNIIAKANFKELELIAIAKGYNKNWIFHQLKSANDFREYGKYKGFKKGWAEMQILKRIV